MDARKEVLIVKGVDKSDAVVSYRFYGEKCDVIYKSSERIFSYKRSNVRLLHLKQVIDPATVIVSVNGQMISEMDQILDFGDFYRFVRKGKKDWSCHKREVSIEKNCLAGVESKRLFEYFKETASAVSLTTEQGINILKMQYDRLQGVSEETVLAKYLDRNVEPEKRPGFPVLIYPFGLNQSQKKAVENAFSSQISIIQGPPGTGKTQTILNIIANAVRNGKTVAVVSNNNSATKNVAEKLQKKNLSFITAFLGSHKNKQMFIESQAGIYPDMMTWQLTREEQRKVAEEVKSLSEELNQMLEHKNRIAEIERELLVLKPEYHYFKEYYKAFETKTVGFPEISMLSAKKLLRLWVEYENTVQKNQKASMLKKLLLIFRYGQSTVRLFECPVEMVIPYIQENYYRKKEEELEAEKKNLERKLLSYQFETKMDELAQKSMKLFQGELSRRYNWKKERKLFREDDFRRKSAEFNKEYPVILSTTYSIKGTLSMNHVYDYLIVDEASQVDLATGVLALASARNVIIVGDQKQLPNVLDNEDYTKADEIWQRQPFDEIYRFTSHSLLSSAVARWREVPSVLLREHYRCHPKIAEFFNQKFYNGDLIVMTKDRGEDDVLCMYRTVEGNHARRFINQRQIDVIKEEVLPRLHGRGYEDIGIIAPYNNQVDALTLQLGNRYKTATVHKFQGQENDAIILSSVDNVISKFVDDPHMLNVAVSRAMKSLTVVLSGDKRNEKTNYGDLAKYIEYNNFEIIDSQIFSVFDLLYKGYAQQRKEYLEKHKRVSRYDSENLMYSVIEKVLMKETFSNIDCVLHIPLSSLIKDYSLLDEQETKYAKNPWTHIDFLFFNKMDKQPVLAVEVDGTAFHAAGSRQAERDAMKNVILGKVSLPVVRLRTDEVVNETVFGQILRAQLKLKEI